MESQFERRWIPLKNVTRHSGADISDDMDFFAAPPSEIGLVLTADSSLLVTAKPLSQFARFALTLLIALISTGAVMFVLGPFSIVVTLIVGGLTFLALDFSATCSYVGERGIVEFSLCNSRSARPKSEVLMFDDATQLLTRQARRFRNGIYQGTSYRYQWVRRDETAMTICGVFRDRKGWPKDGDRWHFANSAEGVWTSYLLPVINHELEHCSHVEFPMQGKKFRAVRVSPNAVEFVRRDGDMQRVEVNELKGVALASGEFLFRCQDSQGSSGKDCFDFPYSDMPNAKLFLLCLEQVAGLDWV